VTKGVTSRNQQQRGSPGSILMADSEDPSHPDAARIQLRDRVRRRAYLGSIITFGASVVVWSTVQMVSDPPGAMWFVLVGLTLVTGWATFRMPNFPLSFSLSDTFTIMAALLFGPAAGTVVVAIDGLVISFRFSRSTRTLTRVLFNVTAPALAMWLAAQAFFRIAGTGPLANPPATIGPIVGPLAFFAAAYFLLNTGLVAGAIAIGRQASLYGVWREHFLPLWLTHFGGTSIAGLLLLLMSAGLANLHTLTLALPLMVVLLVAFRVGVERLRGRSAQLAELRSYAAALRSTADAVLLTDAEGLITFINPTAERLTGWREAEARGKKADEVFRMHPVPAQTDRQGIEVLSDEGSIREYVLMRRDGTTCPIEETHAYIRDEDEVIIGVIRTFRDISQRKAIEAEHRALLHREQEARATADAANRSKDEFLATLSHELRTPATAIIGWAHILKGGRLDDERAQKALAALERSARAQASVVNDLLDISRIVRGTLRLEIRRTNLPDVIKEAVETVEPAVKAKNLDLRLNIQPDVSTIDADPDRLRQALWNVLSNAAKFTPEGGWIEVFAARDRDAVRIEVSDNGVGIDPAFLPFVFDRFRQADSSSTRLHSGLGLGLAIVRHLVEQHGGAVEAQSAGAGQGSRFIIRLPANVRRRESDEEKSFSV
jgi:PAS domain S-box-containing protein